MCQLLEGRVTCSCTHVNSTTCTALLTNMFPMYMRQLYQNKSMLKDHKSRGSSAKVLVQNQIQRKAIN